MPKKKLRMTIELTLDTTYYPLDDEEERDWFFNDILKKDRLILHSNEIGDEVGTVKVIKLEE